MTFAGLAWPRIPVSMSTVHDRDEVPPQHGTMYPNPLIPPSGIQAFASIIAGPILPTNDLAVQLSCATEHYMSIVMISNFLTH